MMRRSAAALLAMVIAAGVVLPLSAGPAEAADVKSAFTDDDWSVHEADINGLAAAGITKGCNPPANTRFCPNDLVTRGEMAAFLARAFRLPAADPAPFRDIAGSVFVNDIARLAAARITLGCNPPENDRYCPGDPVTRDEMASFLMRALELQPRENGRFTDIAGSVHRRSINAIAAAGVTKGCNPPANTRYCPSQRVTRAQMASFLVRALPDVDPIPTRLLLRPGSPCSRDRTQCWASIVIPAGRTFMVREGWYQTLPYRGGEKSAFQGPDTRFDLSIDGVTVPMQLRTGTGTKQATRDWTYIVPGLSRGTHTLRGVWRWKGKQDLVVTVVVGVT